MIGFPFEILMIVIRENCELAPNFQQVGFLVWAPLELVHGVGVVEFQ